MTANLHDVSAEELGQKIEREKIPEETAVSSDTCLCCYKNKAIGFIMSFYGQIKMPVCKECVDNGASGFADGSRMGVQCELHKKT